MRPQRWDTKELPYDIMWEDDKIWVPEVIKDNYFEYRFVFNEDNKIYKEEKII
ncbi:MAG: hypothetical protein WCJ81_07310 [bacterium]